MPIFYSMIKKANALFIAMSLMFVFSLGMLGLHLAYQRVQTEQSDFKHYYERQMMMQLFLADYLMRKEYYPETGSVQMNTGKIDYRI